MIAVLSAAKEGLLARTSDPSPPRVEANDTKEKRPTTTENEI
jgi:hypothetical protein